MRSGSLTQGDILQGKVLHHQLYGVWTLITAIGGAEWQRTRLQKDNLRNIYEKILPWTVSFGDKIYIILQLDIINLIGTE